MKLLNVGCGGHRPQDEHWWNLDQLHQLLKPGTPERTNLDAEPRYVECDLMLDEIPFPEETFDGILIQHVLEHFDCHLGVAVLEDCRRVLKPGGILAASVPNASYFRKVHAEDTVENAKRLFGESISGDWQDSQCKSFFEYALFHREHVQILSEDCLWALLRRAGFEMKKILSLTDLPASSAPVVGKLMHEMNRLPFSTILYAIK